MGEAERIREAYGRRATHARDERYALTDPANLYLFQRRERAVVDLLRRHDLHLGQQRIVDVGCGVGHVLLDLVRFGANPSLLAGVDLLPERVAGARERAPGAVALAVADASALPFRGGAFDMALQFTLVSSVLDAAMRARIASETLRVLRPGGRIVWYDFIWNPLNRDTRGVGLKELRAMYGGCRIDARRVTLAPPLSRRLARVSWTLCRLLEALPFLRSHLLAIIQKPT